MTAPKRHDLRQAVVQFLYYWEVAKPAITDLQRCIDTVWEAFELPVQGKDFCVGLITGTLQNLPKIDKEITERAQNWEIGRVHKVDLTILRLALYELYFRPDIPPIVSINEAVELAKTFSSDESGKFINGILDKVAPTLGRDLRKAVE